MTAKPKRIFHDRAAIAAWVDGHPRGVTRAQAMAHLGITAKAFQALFTQMRKDGLVLQVGSNVRSRWCSAANLATVRRIEAEHKAAVEEKWRAVNRVRRSESYARSHPNVKRRPRAPEPPAPDPDPILTVRRRTVSAKDAPPLRPNAPKWIFEMP